MYIYTYIYIYIYIYVYIRYIPAYCITIYSCKLTLLSPWDEAHALTSTASRRKVGSICVYALSSHVLHTASRLLTTISQAV